MSRTHVYVRLREKENLTLFLSDMQHAKLAAEPMTEAQHAEKAGIAK